MATISCTADLEEGMAALATLDDMAGLEAGQEGARIFRAAQQAEPQLFAGERGQQRVGEIIDLDQVFEFQVHLLSGQGGSLSRSTAARHIQGQ